MQRVGVTGQYRFCIELIQEPGFHLLGRMRVFGAPCVATVIWAHSGVRRDGHHKVKNVERIYGKTDTD
jgi:hypothetical protein